MAIPSFDLERPRTVAEACALLLADPAAEAIAGGTEVLFAMKNRTRAPRRLVDLDSIPGLDAIEHSAARGLEIGARVTLAKLAAHAGVVRWYPAVAEAARLVASPQIQSMATVAGNLCQDTCCLYVDRAMEQRDALGACLKLNGEICHVVSGSGTCWANYAGDLAPILIAVGATVMVASARGEERRPLRSIFSGDGKQPVALSRGELITRIHVPPPPPRSGAAYLKLRQRQSLDYPVLGAAAGVTLTGNGAKVTVVLTGVDRAPVVVEESWDAVTNTAIESLARLASHRVHPVKNAFGYGPSYRVRAARPFVTRAIRMAMQRADGGRA